MVPLDSQGYVDGTGKWYSHTRQEISALPGRPSTVGKARRRGEGDEACKYLIRFDQARSWDASTVPSSPDSWYDNAMGMWDVACWGRAR